MNDTFYVDDITYNDLELDEIYKLINHTKSTAGADTLMKRLRNPYIRCCDKYIDFLRLLDELSDEKIVSPETLDLLTKKLEEIGYLKNNSYIEILDKICSGEKQSNTKHYLFIALLVISFALIFVSPGFGIVLFFIMLAVSVTDYFKCKSMLSDKLSVFSYIIRMLKCTGKLSVKGIDTGEGIERVTVNKINELLELNRTFKPFMSFSFFIQPSVSTSGNIVSLVLDYVRIILHADIIKYNSMISFLAGHRDDAVRLYEIIGDIDAALSICEFKKKFAENGSGSGSGNDSLAGNGGGKLCKPVIFNSSDEFILTGAYHPLIENPVVNSIDVTKNVLLTGSNASGKSTYLKTIAINMIMAQSFFFAFAEELEAGSMRVYTSMALRDSIKNNESYFMAEIKSLKRIFDAGKAGVSYGDSESECDKDAKVLCIIDEVLRGTNTVERISASVEILKALCSDNYLCFAATHDIELTELLKDEYDNYCFKEEYDGGDIKFDYKLHQGSADTRNAIKLLSVLGFDDSIVNAAQNRALKYLETGSFA